MLRDLSIYIHWPFCKSKCPYCDFNSHVRTGIESQRWQKALLNELAYYAGKLPDRQVVSIFFGGGTPSLMAPETVAALIDAICAHWKVTDSVEITLEANPTSIEAEKFEAFQAAGVNRVSIGIQSLSTAALKFLGREHSVDEALAALDIANDIFPRVSFDLIYARPNQTLSAWEEELKKALEYAKDHISLYQLTIEENTAFYSMYHQGAFSLPQDNIAADLYMLTQDVTEAHGLPAYEISNHAKPGSESRHNLAYWRSGDYIGIGPGAHGRYMLDGIRHASENIKSPERWLERIEQSVNGVAVEIEIAKKEAVEETVMMGLRLSAGIIYNEWEEHTGIDVRSALDAGAIDKLCGLSLITSDNSHIKATREGRLLLNTVTKELLVA